MEPEILFSIIIPVKNGDHWLENLFQKLMQQTLIGRSEIIIIDSGSTDGSLEIIKKYPVKLIQVPASEFNHGETRNVGVREAKGKYVVMTVQDAVPMSDMWLQYFLDAFINENVVGVCGQQLVPHDLDKNPVQWFRIFSSPKKELHHYDNPADLLNLSPKEQRQNAGLDNVTAAYNREVLLQHPFPKIDFGEDIFWAREMLLKGYTLASDDEIRVFHYHHYSGAFIIPRYFSVYYFEYKLFKAIPEVTTSFLMYILSCIKILLKERSVSWKGKFKWLIFNIRYKIACNKAIAIFNSALDKGEDFLDAQYQQICNKVPQAPKY
jgi:rhamnosyltransferase